ncbi:MAG: hypothetical protein ACLPX5_16335 [Dissulfurispiraceae bacterium]
MQDKRNIIVLVGILVTALASCATYKTTLTDAQGRTITCEASGKSGIVTGYYLRRGFEDCISAAKAQGFEPIQDSDIEGSRETMKCNASGQEELSNPPVNKDAVR